MNASTKYSGPQFLNYADPLTRAVVATLDADPAFGAIRCHAFGMAIYGQVFGFCVQADWLADDSRVALFTCDPLTSADTVDEALNQARAFMKDTPLRVGLVTKYASESARVRYAEGQAHGWFGLALWEGAA